MPSIQSDVRELRDQLKRGSIQRAYGALIAYMLGLRADYANRYGESAVSGLYQGYMDMTYFALLPPSLKPHGLKIAIVFNYEAFRFEVWLAARNRKVQRQTWELFKDTHWDAYRVIAPATGIDSIVECDLASDFDLGQAETLTSRIENAVAAFTRDMEKFLSEQMSVGT